MITLHDAIFAINPNISIIRGEEAFDRDGNPIEYDMTAAQAKLIELQQAKEQEQQQAEAHKASAISKLTALGLSADEIKALTGVQP